MEDIVLKAELDDSTCVYVSPIARVTYDEHVLDDNLGGNSGYFVLLSYRSKAHCLEVLAKAPTFEAAGDLFDLIVRGVSSGPADHACRSRVP